MFMLSYSSKCLGEKMKDERKRPINVDEVKKTAIKTYTESLSYATCSPTIR